MMANNPIKTQMIILSVCSILGRDPWLITLPHLAGLGDYTYTPLIGICRTIFPSANGVHQTLCGQEAISANRPHNGAKYWSTGWESKPRPETHNLRPKPLSQWCWWLVLFLCSNGFILEQFLGC